MTTSFRNRSRSQWFRLYQPLRKRLAKKLLASSMRAGLLTMIVAGFVVPVPTRSLQHLTLADARLACQPPSVDLAFIIDRSGSFDMAKVGQAYNVQIDGVLRALRDPSVIPRDGSVAVTVETFAGNATIQVPFKQIDTAADAEGIAQVVESLRCSAINCTPTGSCPVFGSNPASNYAPAITTADEHLKDNQRAGARRVLLLSSDGQPSDPEKAAIAAQRAGDELDIILMTLDPDARKDSADQSERDAFEAFHAAKEKADTIVYPQPPDDLPGKTLPIKNGVCNNRCASPDDSAVKADCDRQVKEFAELTRDVLRRLVVELELTVNTQADPESITPNTLSLRHAIERANDNGGATNITFTSAVKTIKPLTPLPALASPGITIDGIEGRDSLDPVTIDGAMTLTAQGEQRDDGILIRSSRCHVRRLKIINFKRAGVGVEPVSMCDNVGFNVIERNRFENNKTGVCVLDPPPGPGAIFHNVGNTISMNDISGSATPIDLGSPAPIPPSVKMSICDGPTANDEGDLDEGPNTLLNSPNDLKSLLVGGADGTVTITGLISPPAGGGTVEIFAENFKSIQNAVAFDSVVYLGSTSLIGNSFTVSVPSSPAGAYSATLTDSSGNTSELEICSSAQALVPTQSSLAFRAIGVGDSDSLSFGIKNSGCVSVNNLDFKLFRIVGKKEKKDDSGVFSVEPQGLQQTFPMRIELGDTQMFNLRFKPAIPPFVAGFASSPSLLLPERIHGKLKFSSDAGEVSLDIFADVAPHVFLINADGTQVRPAPTLTRSGDIFEVTFYVFDSDPFDIKDVVFEFAFDDNGKCVTVPVDNDHASPSLAEVITQVFNPPPPVDPTKRKGQSLKIIQRFSNANQHPETRFVRVTVIGLGPNNTAPCCAFPCDQASAQAVHNRSDATLILPPLKLIPAQGEGKLRFRKAGRSRIE